MTPEILKRWESIVNDVEKTKIPVEFIHKLVLKLDGRRQKTINVRAMVKQGLESEEIEEAVTQKLQEYDSQLSSIDFILDIEGIASIVQPETDKMLQKL
jgi:hypothetical protein